MSELKAQDRKLLDRLREDFKDDEIGKRPQPTRQQTDLVKKDYREGVRCAACGGWHHPQVVHLDYVGHAAVTARLLEVDKVWFWEPMAVGDHGEPLLDEHKLLWIKLTVLGVTRIGCGDAGDKTGGNAMKERIGDAIRNAGMRFGMALDLWHKGNEPLYADGAIEEEFDQTEYYDEAEFERNFPVWERSIKANKKTTDEVIDFLNGRGANLSPAQIKKIEEVKNGNS